MRTLIIGGGAAGLYLSTLVPYSIIVEKEPRCGRKLYMTGGGRCNFTNTEIDGGNPKAFYPRGAGFLRKPLMGYGCAKTREFFKTLGVESKVEDCGRVFPI